MNTPTPSATHRGITTSPPSLHPIIPSSPTAPETQRGVTTQPAPINAIPSDPTATASQQGVPPTIKTIPNEILSKILEEVNEAEVRLPPGPGQDERRHQSGLRLVSQRFRAIIDAPAFRRFDHDAVFLFRSPSTVRLLAHGHPALPAPDHLRNVRIRLDDKCWRGLFASNDLPGIGAWGRALAHLPALQQVEIVWEQAKEVSNIPGASSMQKQKILSVFHGWDLGRVESKLDGGKVHVCYVLQKERIETESAESEVESADGDVGAAAGEVKSAEDNAGS